MSTPRRLDWINCTHCGEENGVSESTCRSCSRGLTVYIGPAQNVPRRFGLGPLMLLVAVIALALGVLRAVPVFGVAMLMTLPPAVIRTTAFAAQRAEDGRPMIGGDLAYTFVASIAVMLVVIASSFISFGLVCLPLGMVGSVGGGSGMAVAGAIAIGVGLYVAYRVLRVLWPCRE